MKAVMMTAVGGPEVLKINEIAKPVPNDNQVLVRLKAAGLNPLDYKLRKRGTHYPHKMPVILGCDGAGVVEKAGRKVTKYKPGAEVYFCYGGIGDHPGNYAEYNVVDENYIAAKPPALSFLEAGAVPLALITAWECLFDRLMIKKGQNLLIHAGAGGVGHLAIQLAKITGCHVVTTVGSTDRANFATSLGADETILYKERDFVEAVLRSTHGIGADAVVDTVGGDVFNRSLRAVRHYGDLTSILAPPEDADWNTARIKNLRISFELMLTPMSEKLPDSLTHQATILEKCGRLFDESRLKVNIDRIFPLAEAAAAQHYLETNSAAGKVVLTI